MTAGDRIATALNRLIATDSLAQARFAPLAGRVVQIAVRDTPLTVFVGIESSGLMLAMRCPRAADIRIEGSLGELLAMVRRGEDGAAISAGRVQIQGDLATVQQLQILLADLDIDWEELLAERVGDVAAHQIGRVVRGAAGWIGHARRSLERDVGDYVQYEAQLVPTAADLEEFTRDTLLLAEDVDRLAARIARLQRSRGR